MHGVVTEGRWGGLRALEGPRAARSQPPFVLPVGARAMRAPKTARGGVGQPGGVVCWLDARFIKRRGLVWVSSVAPAWCGTTIGKPMHHATSRHVPPHALLRAGHATSPHRCFSTHESRLDFW
eukprot:179460-Chlamydomonas_euryale.AAC.1